MRLAKSMEDLLRASIREVSVGALQFAPIIARGWSVSAAARVKAEQSGYYAHNIHYGNFNKEVSI